jgi:hypothetical protein
MKFNEFWTKEKNDELRKMRIEKKSIDEIYEHFGEYLLQYHPNKKFGRTNKFIGVRSHKLVNYRIFNEIKINPNAIDYKYEWKRSKAYPNFYDFHLHFTIGVNNYIIVLFHLKCKNVVSYNILFTTEEQFNRYNNELDKLISQRETFFITPEQQTLLASILEEETELNEPLKVINAISFIMFDFYNEIFKINYPTIPFSIGDTVDKPKKINFYRNIIKSSFKNVEETEDIDDIGNRIYYYKIKN